MDPLVTLGIAIVAAVVGFLLGRVSAGMDRQDRLTDEQKQAQREAMLTYIRDMRDRLLATLELAEIIASGDAAKAAIVHERWSTAAAPAAMQDLSADPELVHELTTTVVEVVERGWGKSSDPRWNARLGHVGVVIRDAFRRQEQRVLAGEQPLLVTPDQAEAMNAAKERVLVAMEGMFGPAPAGTP